MKNIADGKLLRSSLRSVDDVPTTREVFCRNLTNPGTRSSPFFALQAVFVLIPWGGCMKLLLDEIGWDGMGWDGMIRLDGYKYTPTAPSPATPIQHFPFSTSINIMEDSDQNQTDRPEENKLHQQPAQSQNAHRQPPDQSFSPLSASQYFHEALVVAVEPSRQFRVYINHPTNTNTKNNQPNSSTYFVFHHGGGYSGLSAACFAQQVTSQSDGEFGVLSFDCRAHGSSQVEAQNSGPPDLSLSTLSSDLVDLLATLFPKKDHKASFVLIGHSMGGAVVTEACAKIQERVGQVLGLVILDVVEGSAISSLISMMPLIKSRPTSFASQAECIKYHLDSHTIRNLTSARVSVPSLIRKIPSDSASHENHSGVSQRFEWITDLASSQPYWEGWYRGLSKKFLSQKTARLLVLAGTDRLDKELMIGQMQGKYQLSILPNVGHCIHEDDPSKLADIIIQFAQRNDCTTSDEILARLGKKPMQQISRAS